MSIPHFRSADGASTPVASAKITFQTLRDKKQQGEPITALTAYDYATARLVDEAGMDLILVGDSLAMVVMGYESTLPVTMDEMLHHTRAVRRAVRRALLVADMPYGSYQVSVTEGVANAARFLKEAGAEAVKIEGGASRVELVERLTDAEIPVVAHLGLTPQAVHRMGGYKVQGKTAAAITRLLDDAHALEAAGAALLVLEGVPREVAARITAEVGIPTIGIGAGPECDGQILVIHDLVNLSFAKPAKFVRQYGDAAALYREALAGYVRDVRERSFPADSESYHLPRETAEALTSKE
jgi:3-methyl-2-oxobutanoate hydroxymethyltransferase